MLTCTTRTPTASFKIKIHSKSKIESHAKIARY
jgi:hypothetical protein